MSEQKFDEGALAHAQEAARDNQQGIVSDRAEYRAAVAADLLTHHKMLFELHSRVKALEDAQPKLVLPGG